MNLCPSKRKCKVGNEEKHKGIWSELWINCVKYHTNPTAFVSINIYKQQLVRSDVSASGINVSLTNKKWEVEVTSLSHSTQYNGKITNLC